MAITKEERNHLLDSITNLLSHYDYEYSSMALNYILDVWASEKSYLIEAFKKHPNYVDGQFMIVYEMDTYRDIDVRAIERFSSYIYDVVKEMYATLPASINERRKLEDCAFLPSDLYCFMTRIHNITERTVSDEIAAKLNNIIPEVSVHSGEKTSRVINKICRYLGYDKHPEYNREFAKYADGLSPLTIKRHTILSINPLDYLTMSFGNSWSSCHTIDKGNRRGMPSGYHGQYSSGTMSYMLDPSSMVLYTVDGDYDGKEFWNQPKINRQMFHWGENKLVQSRLYPQGNDYDGSAYEPFRHLAQEIISTIFEFPNLWTTSKGTDAASRYIHSQGTHYADYCYFSNCRLCRPKDDTNEEIFVVGANPICIECGEEHDCEDNINCCRSGLYCDDCGSSIDEDDAIYIDGYAYCRDCVSYCERCGEYHRSESYYIESEGRSVCEWCCDNYYRYCDICDCYEPNDNVRYIETENIYICDGCAEEEIEVCSCCGREYLGAGLIHTDDNRKICSSCIAKEMQDNECV